MSKNPRGVIELSNYNVNTPVDARIRLRPIEAADARRLFDIWSNSEVMHFYDVAPLQSIDEAAKIVSGMLQLQADGKGIRWAIVQTKTMHLIGTCGLAVNHDFKSASIGFELDRCFWGRGLMREALNAAINHVYDQWNLNRIQATTDLDNHASAGLLRSIGFVEEGVMRQWGYWKNVFHDVRLFSLIRADRYGS